MRKTFIFVWAIACLFAHQTQAQRTVRSSPVEKANVSDLFPEIPGCAKVIEPLVVTKDGGKQTAVYQWQRWKGDPKYVPCGSITLRWAPGLKKARAATWAEHFPTARLKIKGYDSWRNSPLCGNDSWLGSIEIYFAVDKVMIVDAVEGAEAIMAFADQVDYPSLSRFIETKLKPQAKSSRAIGMLKSSP